MDELSMCLGLNMPTAQCFLFHLYLVTGKRGEGHRNRDIFFYQSIALITVDLCCDLCLAPCWLPQRVKHFGLSANGKPHARHTPTTGMGGKMKSRCGFIYTRIEACFMAMKNHARRVLSMCAWLASHVMSIKIKQI